VVEGNTHTDESLLSGESVPILKNENAPVVSGSLNIGNVIRVKAIRTGNESALAQIIRLVESALSSRAPIERIVDRVAGLRPARRAARVVDLGVLLAMHSQVADALLHATTILVIACPCALGLATPLAVTAAVGSASQAGLLISDASVLESMEKIDVAVLDKTGTLTAAIFVWLTMFSRRFESRRWLWPDRRWMQRILGAKSLRMRNSCFRFCLFCPG